MFDNSAQKKPVLEIKNYTLGLEIDGRFFKVLNDINFSFYGGKIHAIVGESGCGKTMSVMSVLKLLPKNSKVLGGEIIFENQNILNYGEKQMRQIRGRKIALIPQDPMTSLNPLYTVENQLLEVIMLHRNISKEQAQKVTIETLESVEFKDAKNRIKAYPHELSGGEKQRVSIARAFLYPHKLLLMDEPFSSLDLALKRTLMELVRTLRDEEGGTVLFVTHDVREAAFLAQRALVLRHGTLIGELAIDAPYPRDLLSPPPEAKELARILLEAGEIK